MPKTLTCEEAKALTEKLIHAYESMRTKYTFVPKQLVRWKPGLKNKGLPEYNEPAIVWEVLGQPRFADNAESSGTPYFHEPLDIILAVLDEDDDFVLFHYDSRRFEPFPK
jgi:hypothetical protein